MVTFVIYGLIGLVVIALAVLIGRAIPRRRPKRYRWHTDIIRPEDRLTFHPYGKRRTRGEQPSAVPANPRGLQHIANQRAWRDLDNEPFVDDSNPMSYDLTHLNWYLNPLYSSIPGNVYYTDSNDDLFTHTDDITLNDD